MSVKLYRMGSLRKRTALSSIAIAEPSMSTYSNCGRISSYILTSSGSDTSDASMCSAEFSSFIAYLWVDRKHPLTETSVA
jgi:hypothetical protein